MPIIRGAEITNFQSWVKAQVSFHRGINVIIGPSDEGKSALIRSLRWALLNEAKGSFINWNTKKKELAEVYVEFDEFHLVRQKNLSGSINQYILSTMSDPLKAIKRNIPKEISDLTGISPLNFQKQKTWFLLDKKPGEVAKSFNELSGLAIMDEAIKVANSMIREISTELKFEKAELKKLKSEYKELSWVDDCAEELESLEKALKTKDKVESKLDVLRVLYKKYKRVQSEIKRIKHRLSLKAELNGLKELYSQMSNIQDKISSHKNLIKKSSGINEKISVLRNIPNLGRMLKDLKKESDNMKITESQIQKIKISLYKFNQAKEALSKQASVVSEAFKQFDETLKKLGYCPTCKRKI